jgi:hypothetical protein
MSQRGVERALGKLVTDEAFREAYFQDPDAAAWRAGIELSREEAAALSRIPRRLLAAITRQLDDRICRLALPGQAGCAEDVR